MFNKEDNNSGRRYSCFVCSYNFNSIEEMNDHIVKKHEEGRDYIKCPLCEFSIRDLNLHIKVKHAGRQLPKGYHGPNRSIVWKDTGKTRKKKKKKLFREGHFVSIKNNGKEFYYRSSYECDVLECLELIPEVISYDVEPIKGGIAYLYRGEQHHYFPDISLQFADGHIEIWEIKPANQLTLELNEAKWNAANIFCKTRGWDFIVITEVGISKLKHRVKQERNG